MGGKIKGNEPDEKRTRSKTPGACPRTLANIFTPNRECLLTRLSFAEATCQPIHRFSSTIFFRVCLFFKKKKKKKKKRKKEKQVSHIQIRDFNIVQLFFAFLLSPLPHFFFSVSVLNPIESARIDDGTLLTIFPFAIPAELI